MKLPNRFVLLIAVPGAFAMAADVMVGCFQSYDPASASGSPVTAGDGGGSNTACPPGEVCSSPAAQCTLDSPECFYLCGSPLCALGFDPNNPDAGATIPQATDVPPIYLGSTDTMLTADGSTTTDPCVQIEAQSLFIRQQSCSPCHTAAAGTTKAACSCALTGILDDSTLVTATSPAFKTPAGAPAPYVVPGNPGASLIYERIVSGAMPPPNPALELGPAAAAALVYPTPSDVSVLYEWIVDCVAGTDGGAYGSSYYGGTLGGTTCFGPCGEGGAGQDAGP
jgi:hypothetical protein